jgi:hypothetical protein
VSDLVCVGELALADTVLESEPDAVSLLLTDSDSDTVADAEAEVVADSEFDELRSTDMESVVVVERDPVLEKDRTGAQLPKSDGRLQMHVHAGKVPTVRRVLGPKQSRLISQAALHATV